MRNISVRKRSSRKVLSWLKKERASLSAEQHKPEAEASTPERCCPLVTRGTSESVAVGLSVDAVDVDAEERLLANDVRKGADKGALNIVAVVGNGKGTMPEISLF